MELLEGLLDVPFLASGEEKARDRHDFYDLMLEVTFTTSVFYWSYRPTLTDWEGLHRI